MIALALLVALAQMGPQWQFRVVDRVPPGGKAALVLQPKNEVYDAQVTLRRGTRKPLTFKKKKIAAGSEWRVQWRVPEGVTAWTGTLVGSAGGATTTAPLNLTIASLAQLDVRYDKSQMDVERGYVPVKPTRKLKEVEVKAFDDAGAQVLDALAGLEVKGDLTIIRFEPPEGVNLRRVELKLKDEYGQWASLRLARWYVEIPHEEVVFESGKAELRASEAPKVDKAIALIEEELARFRSTLGKQDASVDVQVYVAGYTDTVGKPADNGPLSRARARAIARHFRAKGLKLALFYEGFGERVLAVPTGNDVDEARNRRARYVVANAPPKGEAFPSARWTRLK